MPFTVSHVAAVVPAYRPLARAQLFSAAVIGSMVPDFGMMLPGNLERWQTHSLTALFTFCLPVGLLTYFLTQTLIKPALLEVLPDGSYSRLRTAHPPVDLRRFSSWLYAAIALLFGALSHLIWDGFTHENARGVHFLPFLSDYGPEMGGHALRLYRWLQYGSSVFGLLVVIGALLLWLRHASASAAPTRRLGPRQRRFWGSLYFLMPLAALASGGVSAYTSARDQLPISIVLTEYAVLMMQATSVSLLLVSGLIRMRLGR